MATGENCRDSLVRKILSVYMYRDLNLIPPVPMLKNENNNNNNDDNKIIKIQVWWHVLEILELERQRQEDPWSSSARLAKLESSRSVRDPDQVDRLDR